MKITNGPDGHALIITDEGERYVLDGTLDISVTSWRPGNPPAYELTRRKHCDCCGEVKNVPTGEVAYSVEDMVTKGWAVAERDYNEWRNR